MVIIMKVLMRVVMMEMMIVEDGDNGEERMVTVMVVVVRVMMIMKIVMANVLYTHFVIVHQPFPYKERTAHWKVYIQWSWFSNDKPFRGGEASPHNPDRGLHTSSLRLQTLRQESTPRFLRLTSSTPGSASCESFIKPVGTTSHTSAVFGAAWVASIISQSGTNKQLSRYPQTLHLKLLVRFGNTASLF